MRRPAVAVLALVLGCTGADKGPKGQADALAELIRTGNRTPYRAAYRYELGGPLRAAVETRMELVQLPPDRLTKVEVSYKKGTTVSWLVERGSESYACAQQPKQVICVRRAPEGDVFGAYEVDRPLRLARTKGFRAVTLAGTSKVAGVAARCYDGISTETLATTSPRPRFEPAEWRYRLCYSSDGVLLSVRRSSTDQAAPPGAVFEFVAVSVSRTVAASDVALPGPVYRADELRPTITPPGDSPSPRRDSPPRASSKPKA